MMEDITVPEKENNIPSYDDSSISVGDVKVKCNLVSAFATSFLDAMVATTAIVWLVLAICIIYFAATAETTLGAYLSASVILWINLYFWSVIVAYTLVYSLMFFFFSSYFVFTRRIKRFYVMDRKVIFYCGFGMSFTFWTADFILSVSTLGLWIMLGGSKRLWGRFVDNHLCFEDELDQDGCPNQWRRRWRLYSSPLSLRIVLLVYVVDFITLGIFHPMIYQMYLKELLKKSRFGMYRLKYQRTKCSIGRVIVRYCWSCLNVWTLQLFSILFRSWLFLWWDNSIYLEDIVDNDEVDEYDSDEDEDEDEEIVDEDEDSDSDDEYDRPNAIQDGAYVAADEIDVAEKQKNKIEYPSKLFGGEDLREWPKKKLKKVVWLYGLKGPTWKRILLLLASVAIFWLGKWLSWITQYPIWAFVLIPNLIVQKIYAKMRVRSMAINSRKLRFYGKDWIFMLLCAINTMMDVYTYTVWSYFACDPAMLYLDEHICYANEYKEWKRRRVNQFRFCWLSVDLNYLWRFLQKVAVWCLHWGDWWFVPRFQKRAVDLAFFDGVKFSYRGKTLKSNTSKAFWKVWAFDGIMDFLTWGYWTKIFGMKTVLYNNRHLVLEKDDVSNVKMHRIKHLESEKQLVERASSSSLSPQLSKKLSFMF